MEWISVNDRLPERNGRYLTVNADQYMNVTSFATNLYKIEPYDFHGKKRPGWHDYDGEYGSYEIENITHWMPLPPAPKEDE